MQLSFQQIIYPSPPPPSPPQHALRLIAFRKAHLVLGVEPLPPPGMSWKREATEPADGDTEEPGAKRARVAEPQKD